MHPEVCSTPRRFTSVGRRAVLRPVDRRKRRARTSGLPAPRSTAGVVRNRRLGSATNRTVRAASDLIPVLAPTRWCTCGCHVRTGKPRARPNPSWSAASKIAGPFRTVDHDNFGVTTAIWCFISGPAGGHPNVGLKRPGHVRRHGRPGAQQPATWLGVDEAPLSAGLPARVLDVVGDRALGDVTPPRRAGPRTRVQAGRLVDSADRGGRALAAAAPRLGGALADRIPLQAALGASAAGLAVLRRRPRTWQRRPRRLRSASRKGDLQQLEAAASEPPSRGPKEVVARLPARTPRPKDSSSARRLLRPPRRVPTPACLTSGFAMSPVLGSGCTR